MQVGDMLTLRLLRRPAGSIIPEPVPTSAFSPSALIVPDALPHGQEPADAVAASGASAAAAEHEHASQSSSSTYGLGKGHYPSSSGSGSGALAAGVPGGGGPVHAPNALDQNPFAKVRQLAWPWDSGGGLPLQVNVFICCPGLKGSACAVAGLHLQDRSSSTSWLKPSSIPSSLEPEA